MNSTVGRGSTLSFTLPLAAAGAEPTNVLGVLYDPSVDLRERLARKVNSCRSVGSTGAEAMAMQTKVCNPC
jgi:hypothetical protein